MQSKPYLYYGKEDMHKAALSAIRAEYDGLKYVFYPYSLSLHRETLKDETPMEVITQTFNRAGYHVHFYSAAWASGGIDLWVETMRTEDKWGETRINGDYKQDSLPVFKEEVTND